MKKHRQNDPILYGLSGEFFWGKYKEYSLNYIYSFLNDACCRYHKRQFKVQLYVMVWHSHDSIYQLPVSTPKVKVDSTIV